MIRIPAASPRQSLRTALLLGLLAALVIAVFAGATDGDFVFDGGDFAGDPNLLRGLTPAGVRWAFTSNYMGHWIPLPLISHLLDVQLFGMRPGPMLTVNVLLHTLNTLLLCLVLFRMTGAIWRSAVVAALFAIHPFHVEAVVYTRADLISTLFGLLAIWAHLRYAQRPGVGRYLVIALWFAASLASKAILVTLPFLLLLLDYWPLNRTPGWRLAWEKIPLLLLASMASLTAFLMRKNAGAMSMADRYSLPTRVANAAASYLEYLRKTFWPSEFAVMYPHPGDTLPLWQPVLGGAVLLLVSAVAVLKRRTFPSLAVGWFWFVGTLVPVIGLVQVGEQAMADRYTYVPLIGLFIAAAWIVPRFGQKLPRFAASAAAGAAVAILAVIATRQIPYWKDSRSLYQHALDVAPDNWLMHANLAGLLLAAGEIDSALDHQRAVVRLRPDLAEARHNLALTLDARGLTEEAVARYRETLRMNSFHPRADYNLGLALLKLGRTAEAVPHLARAAWIHRDDVSIRLKLGEAYLMLGDRRQALEAFRQMVQLDPKNVLARWYLESIRP